MLKTTTIATIGFISLLGYIAFSIHSRDQEDFKCYTTAKDWLNLSQGGTGALNDPKQAEFVAKQLAAFQLACPKGHVMVSQNEQRAIPDALVQLAKQDRIIEAAKRDLAAKEASKR